MIEDIYVGLRDAGDETAQLATGFAAAQGLQLEVADLLLPELMEDAPAREAVLARWKAQMQETGFKGKLSLHAPMTDLNPVSEDRLIAKASRGRYVQAVETAKQLGAKYLIVPSHYSTLIKAENRTSKWLGDMTKFWEQLIGRAVEGSGLVMLIHNTMGETSEHVKTIVNRLSSPNLRAAFSVGHAEIFSKRSPNDWVDELGNMLAYVQVSNNDGKTLIPEDFETGQIDLESFLNHLSLLTHSVSLSMVGQSMNTLETDHLLLQPFLKMQEEVFHSKSFLV